MEGQLRAVRVQPHVPLLVSLYCEQRQSLFFLLSLPFLHSFCQLFHQFFCFTNTDFFSFNQFFCNDINHLPCSSCSYCNRARMQCHVSFLNSVCCQCL